MPMACFFDDELRCVRFGFRSSFVSVLCSDTGMPALFDTIISYASPSADS